MVNLIKWQEIGSGFYSVHTIQKGIQYVNVFYPNFAKKKMKALKPR